MDNLQRQIKASPKEVLNIKDLKEKAAKEFQKALGLTADGKIGPQSMKAWKDFKREHEQGSPELIGMGSFELLHRELEPNKGAATEAAASNLVIPTSPKVNRGASRYWPATREYVFVNDPILPNGNFSYAEFTKGGSDARWPTDAEVAKRITGIAEILEEVRERLGNPPIHITSGYRPPAVNRAVGGARYSQHITGNAADIYVDGLSVDQVFRSLEGWCRQKGIAIAPAYRMQFVHLDNRGWFTSWRY